MINQRIDASQLQLKDTVVSINRVTKVVKGGKNLSFSALVVVGDEGGMSDTAAARPRKCRRPFARRSKRRRRT